MVTVEYWNVAGCCDAKTSGSIYLKKLLHSKRVWSTGDYARWEQVGLTDVMIENLRSNS